MFQTVGHVCRCPLSVTTWMPWKTNPVNLTEWSCLNMVWKVVLKLAINFIYSDTDMCKSVIPLLYVILLLWNMDTMSHPSFSLPRMHAGDVRGRLYGSGERRYTCWGGVCDIQRAFSSFPCGNVSSRMLLSLAWLICRAFNPHPACPVCFVFCTLYNPVLGNHMLSGLHQQTAPSAHIKS